MKKLLTTILLFLCIQPIFAVTPEKDYYNLDFWKKFNDDNLLNNISQTYENNHDLKAMVIKVTQSQRLVKMSLADELPHIGFEGYVGRIFKSSDILFGEVTTPTYTQTQYLFPLSMNYEIDIWGKNHLKTKSKKKQFEMLKQDEYASYIYISTACAVNYFNLIRLDKLIEYQKELIDLQQSIIKSYETKYQFGTSTLSEIEASQKNLSYMKEDLEKYLEKRDILKNQLNVLISDRSFDDIKRTKYENLKIDFNIPDGINFDTLKNRPDRVKSELLLEKYITDIKVARREFLPKFIITGNLGFNFYNLHSSHKFLADLGIVPVLDIFSGGRKIQNLKFKKDEYNIALEDYEKTILKSIQETNDALYSLKTTQKVLNQTKDRLNSDLKELSYTKTRQIAGTKDKLDILIQEEQLIQSQKQVISSNINKIIAFLNLYQALGGVDFTNPDLL